MFVLYFIYDVNNVWYLNILPIQWLKLHTHFETSTVKYYWTFHVLILIKKIVSVVYGNIISVLEMLWTIMFSWWVIARHIPRQINPVLNVQCFWVVYLMCSIRGLKLNVALTELLLQRQDVLTVHPIIQLHPKNCFEHKICGSWSNNNVAAL
jgi:hypothetical protein